MSCERFGQLRVDRGDLLQPVLAQRVVVVRVRAHRPRPVEREHRGDVLEVVRAHQLQQRAHRPAVELEHPERVAAGQQLVRVRVVQLQVLQVQVEAPVPLDVLQGVGDDRQVAQAQEVHLDQPQALAGRVVELGDHLAVLEAAHDRDDVDDRVGAHDHAGGVDAPLALEALDALGGLEDLGRLRVGGDQLAEVRGLAVALGLGVLDVAQRDVLGHDGRRQRLGERLAHAERVAEHARGVLERLLGLDGAVGDDHRHAFVAVLLGDVLDDLGAAAVIEVDVEVGHGDAFGVQEAFEDQPVLQRIQVGDAHGVGDHRPGAGTAAGANADAVVLGPVDEVGHDQEVAGEAHLDDDVQLVVRLLAHLVGDPVGVPVPQAGVDLLDQPAGLVLPRRAGVLGHEVRVGVEGDLAPLGDQQGVVAGVRVLGEEPAHLLRGLQVVAGAGEREAGAALVVGRLKQGGAGLDGQQRLVGLRVVLVRVVQVVGGDQRDLQFLRQPQQVRGDPALDVQAVVHQLAEVVLLAEDVLVLGGRLLGLGVLAQPQPGLDLARRGSRWWR